MLRYCCLFDNYLSLSLYLRLYVVLEKFWTYTGKLYILGKFEVLKEAK